MGPREDIDESDIEFSHEDGGLNGHTHNFYSKSHVFRKDGYGERIDEEDYADFTPKDITGKGIDYTGKGPRNYVRSSERILDDIAYAFIRDRYLDASMIDIDVIGDEVHLTGQVDSKISKWRAEELTVVVPGVKTIINQLKIRSAS